MECFWNFSFDRIDWIYSCIQIKKSLKWSHSKHRLQSFSISSSSSFNHLLSLCKLRGELFMYKHETNNMVWNFLMIEDDNWIVTLTVFSGFSFCKIAHWSKIRHSKTLRRIGNFAFKSRRLKCFYEWNIHWHSWQWTMNGIPYWLQSIEISIELPPSLTKLVKKESSSEICCTLIYGDHIEGFFPISISMANLIEYFMSIPSFNT